MRKNRITLYCLICSLPYEVTPSQIRQGRKYCSRECLATSKRGKPYFFKDRDATIKRQQEAQKGKIITRETRLKISNSLKGRPNPRTTAVNQARLGPLHPRWKGGVGSESTKIRNSDAMVEWKKKVLKRDGYTCGFCGQSPSGHLAADHIRPFSLYPELRNDVANGQTLCEPCHYFKTRIDHYFYDNFRTRL
jgi:5-methylcytosine-specific restriction endonuclease McrA